MSLSLLRADHDHGPLVGVAADAASAVLVFCLTQIGLSCRSGVDRTKQRTDPTPEEKVAIRLRHPLDEVRVSIVCREAAIRRGQF